MTQHFRTTKSTTMVANLFRDIGEPDIGLTDRVQIAAGVAMDRVIGVRPGFPAVVVPAPPKPVPEDSSPRLERLYPDVLRLILLGVDTILGMRGRLGAGRNTIAEVVRLGIRRGHISAQRGRFGMHHRLTAAGCEHFAKCQNQC